MAETRSLLRDLVEACLDRIERDGDQALETFCGEHPEHATDIRRRVKSLMAMGLVEPKERATGRDPVAVPKRLGEFLLKERMGGGGMGEVYRAVQDGLLREVAVKVVRPECLWFDGARDRFRREAEAVARLQHPGIVPVYTVGEENGLPFFAMELVAGASLGEVLGRLAGRSPIELTGRDLIDPRAADPSGKTTSATRFEGSWVRACLRIVYQVALALQHAHERGVQHRDVKPSNIMLTADGRARLLDFGLASLHGSHRLTRTGTKLGSPYYMAPELVRAEGEVDERADVYSLGVTLYELLTLLPPFRASTEEALLLQIVGGAATRVSKLNPSVPWDVETVCMKAMDVEPARRYQTAQDFADDLLNILELRPIQAARPSTGLRLRRWAQRRPGRALGALLAFVVLVVLPSLLWMQQLGANRRILDALVKERAAAERADTAVSQALGVLDDLLDPLTDARLRTSPMFRDLQRRVLDRTSGSLGSLGDLAEQGKPEVRKHAYEVLLTLGRMRAAVADEIGFLEVSDGLIDRLGRNAAQDPNDVSTVILLERAHYERASSLAAFDRLEAALGHLGLAEQYGTRMLEKQVPGAALRLAKCRGLRAHFLILLGRYQEGIELHRRVVADLENLQPVPKYRALAAFTYADELLNLGAAYLDVGKADDALSVLTRAQDMISSRRDQEFLADLRGTLLLMIGQAYADSGQSERGSEFLSRGIEVLNAEVGRDGLSSNWGDLLIKALLHAAETQLDLDDPEKATQLFEQAATIGRQLLEIYPNRISHMRSLANAQGSLGDLALSSGDFAVARERYQEAIRLLDAVIEESECDRDHQNQSQNYINLAAARQEDGDLEGGLGAGAAAVQHARRLMEISSQPDASTLILSHMLIEDAAVAWKAGDHQRAADRADETATLAREPVLMARAALTFGDCAFLVGQDEGLDEEERRRLFDRYSNQCIDWLTQVLERDPTLAYALDKPSLDSVRDQPAFEALYREYRGEE